MKKFALITLTAVAGLAVGCTPAANTTNTTANVKANGTTTVNANANTAVVVNSSAVNTNGTGVSTMDNTTGTMTGAALTRADYDRDKDKYAAEAKSAGRKIGTGANDGWLWTKTKTSLASTADLRDSTINVDVDNAVVTLTGTVATKEQSDKAAAAAKAIEGVTSVKNSLKISAGDSLTNQMTGGTTDGDKKAVNSNK